MPMVCFCDIPLARITEHVLFYGDYGVGLTREWALRNDLAPVLYVTPNSPISTAILAIDRALTKATGDERERNVETLNRLTANIKPVEGVMTLNGSPIRKEFYQESEWRYVPNGPEILSMLDETQYQDPDFLRIEHEKTKEHGMLRFSPADVRYIFVKSDADIPSMMNFLQTELDSYPNADLKILMSRITSLESLSDDW